MKAYKIQDDIVAAHNEEQAIGTWAAHFEVETNTAGPCEEIDPSKYMVAYEQDDGSFQEGTLSEIMPEDAPEVVIDAENS